MGARIDILELLVAKGLRIRPTPEGNLKVSPRRLLTEDTRRLILEHKAELLQVLPVGPEPAVGPEARRGRALGFLAAHPETQYALVTDLESDPDAVLVTLAIRGEATCDLTIPRDKWDGVLFLDLLEKHCATGHLH